MGGRSPRPSSSRASSSTSSFGNAQKPAHPVIPASGTVCPRTSFGRVRRGGALTQPELNAAIVDAVADPIVTVDDRHRVIAMNSAAEAVFGWDRTEVEGHELVDLLIPPDVRARQRRKLESLLDEADQESGSRTTRVIAARRDGRRLPVEVAVTRLGSEWPARFACFVRETMLSASGLAAERDPLTGLATREIGRAHV